MQAALGVEEDGDWGPVTEKAFRTTLINQRDGAENAISEIFAAAAAEQERAEKAQPQLAYGTAQVGQYLAAPASVQKPVYLTADGSRTNVPTGTSPKQEQVYLTADGKRTNVPGITASPASSGSKGSTDTAAYDRTMQTADASRLGGTAKSTLAAPTYNRTALTADVPHGAAAERGNIYNTADGKRTNVVGGARNSGIGRRTAMEKGEPIARLGGAGNIVFDAPSYNRTPQSVKQVGEAVPEWVVERRTEALLRSIERRAKQEYMDSIADLSAGRSAQKEQRAKQQERYAYWKRSEEQLNDFIAKKTRKAADAMIPLGKAQADETISALGLSKGKYPKNAKICSFDGSFETENEMLSYMGSMLNRFTEVSDQEHMCNLYKITQKDGTVKYAAGEVHTGMSNNVILPYIEKLIYDADYLYLSLTESGAKVEHLGLLHSHPQRWNGEDNDEFSLGDGLVAAISGKIYLTTPEGNLYALSRRDAWKPIILGIDYNKTYNAQYGTPIQKVINRIVNGPLWPYYALRDYHKLKEWNFAETSGPNFETFDANSYYSDN